MTEYKDWQTGKRRLKDLSHFIVSEDNKRIIACITCCQFALTSKKFTDATYYPVEKTPDLTLKEQFYLKQWEPISQECIEDLTTEKTKNASQENSITVTSEFFD